MRYLIYEHIAACDASKLTLNPPTFCPLGRQHLCAMTLSVICNVIVTVLNVFTLTTPAVTFLYLVSPVNALYTKL